MLNNNSVLITGGTGSFGQCFVKTVLATFPNIKRLVIFSRDELKQYEMEQLFSVRDYPMLRYFIGDVREKNRLVRAMEGIDCVIHAAALKQVPACEYNPFEAIKTNIMGAQNVIESAIESGVQRVIALSTDKAAAPTNLYGATKLCSDKLFIAANNSKGKRDIKFSVVRYGNVFGSRGSVVPLFLKQRIGNQLTITDERMTRFNITLQQGIDFVLRVIEVMWGGEIFVPKIPSYRILDVAKAIAPDSTIEVIGIRPGEKLHEEMITETDALNTIESEDCFIILPPQAPWDICEFEQTFPGDRCPEGFSYSSGTNRHWLSIADLIDLIKGDMY